MTEKPTYEELEKRIQELEQTESNCRRIEKGMRKSEEGSEKYLNVFDFIGVGVFIVDYDYCIRFMNNTMIKWFGDQTGLNCHQSIAGLDLPCSYCRIKSVIDSGENINYAPTTPDGRAFDITCFPICNSDGSISKIEIIREITEHKKAEKILQRSEALLKATQKLTKVGGWEWNAKDQTMFWTEEVYRIHDFQPSEFSPGSTKHIERSIECYDPEDRSIIMKAFRDCAEKGRPYDLEFPFSTVKGRRIWIRTIAKPVKENGTIIKVIGNIMDITERKKMEKALRESEVKYRSMMNAMKDPVYICSHDYQIEYMNPAMIRVLDRDATGELCFKAIHGLDEICTWCMHGKTFQNECFEYDIISPKNNRHYQVANSPIVHEDGSISKMTIFKDITDLIIMEDQYRQAQKMESVGRLAGGVAHDFNNALSVIISTSELAIDNVDPTGQLREDLDEILMAAKRAADITRQLLAFARKQTISPKVLDLNENVKSMLKMLQRLIGEDIDLAWLPGSTLWAVKMDPSQVDQILANLCVNARDAIEGVGKVTIETGNVTFTKDYCDDHLGFIPGEFVLLAVSDNGCGMDKEILGNIFEPFFTTKDVDKGTGLGLATVYGIVKQNNGFINVYSEPGKGTTIKIYLSRHEGKIVESQEESAAEIPSSQGETILVVEDDPAILKIIQKILEGLGYTVLTSNAPEKVMDIVKEYTGKIHLLITDVVMPKMNGHDLAKLLQAICPDLKCMFMSGYTANAIVHQGVLDKGVNFIQKPFSRKELAETVRKVLDEN